MVWRHAGSVFLLMGKLASKGSRALSMLKRANEDQS